MYVYQNGKLYLQVEDKLVGVEIYSDNVVSVEDSETVLADKYQLLTPHEVRCQFQITEDNPYIFPREIQEQLELVVEEEQTNEPIKPIKRTARKSTSK